MQPPPGPLSPLSPASVPVPAQADAAPAVDPAVDVASQRAVAVARAQEILAAEHQKRASTAESVRFQSSGAL